MPKLKEGELMTPLKGVCDTAIRGEGIIDLSEHRSFVGLDFRFIDEGVYGSEVEEKDVYSTISVSSESKDPDMLAFTDLLCKLIKKGMKEGV